METITPEGRLDKLETIVTNMIISQKYSIRKMKMLVNVLNLKFDETAERFKETDVKLKEITDILNQRSKETAEMSKETELKLKETSKSIDRLTTQVKNIYLELGGIGKTNGLIAESIFYRHFKRTMKAGTMHFDYIDQNVHRKKDEIEGEYDIILYNDNKILVIEVKYFFRMHYLKKFYQTELEKFKILFPNYANYKIYGAVAAIHFEKDVIEEAKRKGLYIFKEEDKQITIINDPEFMPTDINKKTEE